MSRRWSAVLVLVAALALAPAASAASEWTRVGTGITEGVSGLAAASSGGWVMVRDNKLAGQTRVALLSDGGTATALTWPGTAPADLESIAAVPGQPGRYVVVGSGGAGRLINVTGTTLSVVRSFRLPQGTVQNEGFALTTLGASTVAVWGNRGSPTVPGQLYAAVFNPARTTFGAVTSVAVTVPWPTKNIRHISDVVLIGPRIVISSASDNGNNGPFESAVYEIGTVGLSSGAASLTTGTPVSLGTYPGHKVEGLACVAGAELLGTDDENLGGWTTPSTWC
ncbi:conserved exported hypothetical protein [metagenome]|uniref:Uncharacterized protein n=1 Tax=metagenome TaxID=256318 RepID=A0A2P2CCB5_9ZZZZ